MMNFLSKIEKRQRLMITVFFSSVLVLVMTFFNLEFFQIFLFLLFFSLVLYFLIYFSLLEGINRAEWYMLFVIPIYFSVSFVMFYYLLPGRWLTRLPFIIIYAIFFYASLLSSNIFNVGVEKNIQLYRAAFSVNYLLVTFCSYLIYNLIFSLKLNSFFNVLLLFFVTLPISIQFYWSINPSELIEKKIFQIGLISSILLAEIGLIISYLPFKTSLYALFLSVCLYSYHGLFQAFFEAKIFFEKIREYLIVLGFVLIICLMSLG